MTTGTVVKAELKASMFSLATEETAVCLLCPHDPKRHASVVTRGAIQQGTEAGQDTNVRKTSRATKRLRHRMISRFERPSVVRLAT